jgi:hypothetical protein
MISCKQANEMDLVNYLEKLGYHPTRISRNDYWYLSPLRDEKTASFKVNRKLNLWFDHGNGKGGTLVDFGTSLFNCSVKEFLKKLGEEHLEFSFHQPLAGEKKKKVEEDSKIKILQVADIRSLHLIQYLKKRSIHPELAEKFCREIFFELYRKKYNAIGFQNNSGGWELRNEFFKGSTSPKDIRLILGNDSASQQSKLLVFEGFFNFLSFKTLDQKHLLPHSLLTSGQDHFLILNSLSFFEKSRFLMEEHKRIELFLDRDTQGVRFTKLSLEWSPKYKDQSRFYEPHKDLNEYLQHMNMPFKKQVLRKGKHF